MEKQRVVTYDNATHRIDKVLRGKYMISDGLENEFNVCYNDTVTPASNIWQARNPLSKTLPTFMLQLSLIIFFTHFFMIVLHPLRQPRIVSEILAGLVMGPSGLGILQWVSENINAFEGTLFLETMANVGVTCYMFMVGLEMDLDTIPKMGKTAFSVALCGTIVPAFAGFMLYFLVLDEQQKVDLPPEGGLFWGIALTVTSFPDLVRILSDLKLMYTDLGKTALTSTVLTEILSWCLLVIVVAFVNGSWWNLLPILGFCGLSWWVVRPILAQVVRSDMLSTDGEFDEVNACFALSGALLFGFLTESCGVHSMFGAFMFGLIIPSGELGTKVIEKVEEYVVAIMMPPVFYVTGLRTNFQYLTVGVTQWLVPFVLLVACSAKILSILVLCLCLKCSFRDSFALGVLMNTKGVFAIIVLNEGRDGKAFDQQTFSWMILAILLMTGIVGPVVSFTHKSARHLKKHYKRNLERNKPDADLRVLACVHSLRNVSGLVSLLNISHASRKSLLTLFAVHLVELTGRASAMLIFHDKTKTTDEFGNDVCLSREKAEEEQIIHAFKSFQSHCHAALVHPLTVVSSYANMDQDIRNFALEKHVTLILLPFHKKPNGALGGWIGENAQHKHVTEHLLANAPCSIGILVDRGLTSPQLATPLDYSQSERYHWERRIAVLFLEGPDYREALAYAWRLAANPHVSLTVVRFIPGRDVMELEVGSTESDDDDDSDLFSAMFEKQKEKMLDDDYINEFRFRTMHDSSISFIESPINSGDQLVSSIRSSYSDFHLYVVGRAYGIESPITAGLSEWGDCPELGVMAETLAAVEFLPSASILVMQQSTPTARVLKKNTVKSCPTKGPPQRTISSKLPIINEGENRDDDFY